MAVPDSIILYAGTCGSLTRIKGWYGFVLDDTTVILRENYQSGAYFLKVYGASSLAFFLPPAYNNNCTLLGCNLIPNGDFEVGNGTTTWGVFNSAVDCWGNASIAPNGATPDLADIGADPVWCPNEPGIVCFQNSDFFSWPINSGGDRMAHLVIYSQANQGRREYVQVPVTMTPNSIYYTRFGIRNDEQGEFYNDAFSMRFTQSPIANNTSNQILANTGNDLDVDFVNTGAYNNNNWRAKSRIFQNDGVQRTNLVIGNFESVAATIARNTPNTVATPSIFTKFAWIYLDGFEMYELPNGGNDLTVCAGTPFTLGQLPQCAPPGTVSTLWLGPAGVIGSTPVVSQTLNTPGTYQYTLMITYGGEFFQDVVNVTVTPAVTGVAPVIVSDPCGTTDIVIGGLNASLVYTITSTDITIPAMVNVPAAGGQITIVNPQMSYTGTGTIQITASYPGSVCPPASFILGVAPCCSANPGGLTLVNEPTSPLLGTSISGQVINVFGTVAVDQNTVFDNCVFYMGTDAQIVLDPGVQAEFYACQFQVCNDYMWDRLYVPQTSTLIMVDNTVSYAVRGVYLEDAICQLENNTFEGNLIANQFMNYQAHGQSVIFESNAHVLTGNTYNGIGIHPQSTLSWGGSLWNYNAFVIGTNIEQSVDLTLGSSGQSNNSYTGLVVQYNEQIGVVNYQSVSDFNGGTFTGELAGYVGEDAVCNVGTGGANTFNQVTEGGIRTFGCNGMLRGNQFIGYTSGVEIWNPTHIGETYVFGNSFTSGAHFKGEAIGGVPYNNTQPIRFRVNDNSLVIPNGAFPGTDAITFKGLIAEKASTRKVMAHGNVISFGSPGLWEAGIYAENCPEVLIAANDISGPSGTNGSRRLIGIHVNNSSDGDVANNYLSELHDGIRISGVQTAINYQGTQYTCNNLNACNFGMYFNGADIENQGAVNYSVENQFSLNGADLNGSVISANTQYRTVIPIPSGSVSNLLVQGLSSSVNTNICSTPSSNRTFVQSGISELEIYPNPVNAGERIQLSKIISGKFYLINLQGQVLCSWVLNSVSEIDLSGIPAGTYVMRVENEVFKIIVL